MLRSLYHAIALAALFGAIAAAAAAFAENVDPGDVEAQYAWGENVGWINAEPNGHAGPGVQVSGAGVTGYMWGENIGWISMSCLNRATCATADYGVKNDGLGKLTGYAWGENVGWISFACDNTGDCVANPYGVTIDAATGVWSGYAWGENIGWMSFTNVPQASRVTTDDGDGIAGSADNCAFDANPGQTNTDAAPIPNPPKVNDVTVPRSDGSGDACDPDDDNDGVEDGAEAAGCNGSGALNPTIADTDGDRVRDGAECALGSDPADAGSKPPVPPLADDPDRDGLSNTFEATIGSNPNDVDSDDDGITDGVEYRGYSTSPTSTDTDADACADDTEISSIDLDRRANINDLYLVGAGFGIPGSPVADITKDGAVNIIDIQQQVLNWTSLNCP